MTIPGAALKLQSQPIGLPDYFSSMADMNKASLVALRESDIVSAALAARIAAGVRELVEREELPHARRSQDYLDFERDLIAAVGPEASWLHVGRSRQDMLSTGVSMWLRGALLAVFDDLVSVRHALLSLAGSHLTTVIPTYTHGVQAQPTSAAHYALAFAAGLNRIGCRLVECYRRVNLSPLGAGAGTTSAFKLNRARLAALLGFDGVLDNAFDANLMAPIDSTLELVGILSTLAVEVGQLTQDVFAQFYAADPWLTLDPSAMLTGISSMMPQKRNPRVLELLREQASVIIGSTQSMVLLAHNVSSGMSDVRESVTTVVPLSRVHDLLVLYTRTLEAFMIDPERSLAEVNRDYSAMTSLAEYLVQSSEVPFREAHEFASALTDYGRRHGLTPMQLAYPEATRIYREELGIELPLTESQFAEAIDPARIVATRQGRGGPQRPEVARMLSEAGEELARHRQWLDERRMAVSEAHTMLEREFASLFIA
jgi:argininosuccinate lyase